MRKLIVVERGFIVWAILFVVIFLLTPDISYSSNSSESPYPYKDKDAKLVEKLAEEGDAEAQHQLGHWYDYADGPLKKDDKKAAYWYGLAAMQEHPRAMAEYGAVFINGYGGIALDYKVAISWINKAVSRNDAHGMSLMGLAHARGLGVKTDLKKAEYWHLRSLDIREKLLSHDHPDIAISLSSLAELYKAMGRYDAVEQLLKHALAIREKSLGPDHYITARSLNNLAELYRVMGRFEEAKPLSKRSLAIVEKTLGPDHSDTGISLNNLATLYFYMGRHEDAEPLLKRALAIYEKSLGPDHPHTNSSLNNLAELYKAMGRYGDAEPLFKRSLAINEKTIGPDHPNTATSLNNLAEFYRVMGRYDEAEPLYKRALTIWEKTLGPDHSNTGMLLNNLAALYFFMGRYEDTELLLKRSLTIWEKTLGPDHPDTARSLNNLAELYKVMGRYDEAEPLFKRSLAIWKKTLGPDHPHTALSSNNLALFYHSTGVYDEAEPLYKRSLAINEKTLGHDHPNTAMTLSNMGVLYDDMGRHEGSESLHKRSLAIREKTLGPDHPDTGVSLNNLAELYNTMGRYDEAEPLYKRSLAINEKTLGHDHPNTAKTLSNMGVLYDNMGRHEGSESLHKRSLAIREKTLGPDHPDTGVSLNNLAEWYNIRGRYDEAEPLYKRSLAINEKTLGLDHPKTITSIINIAFFKGITDDAIESLRLFQRGNQAKNRIIQTVFQISSEKEKLTFVEKASGEYEGLLSLVNRKLPDNQQALRIALNLILTRKGIVFDAQARQNETYSLSIDPSDRGLWQKLSSERSRLAKLLQNKPKILSSEQYKQTLNDLQSEIGELERELASKSALVAEELEQREVTTEKLAKRLPKGGVLAEFVKIQDYDWDKGKWTQNHRYLAFILHSGERVELVDLGDAEKLESDIKTLLAILKTPPASEQEAKAPLDASLSLNKLLYEPIQKAIGTSNNLIVSPDGILNLVPFGAMADDSGKFLTERKTITYVTSGRDLMRGSGIKPETELLLAANPEYDISTKADIADPSQYRGATRSRNFAMKFGPLPGTALEAKTIPGMLKGKKKSVLTGAKASEKSVRSAYRPRVLHLATHGFFQEDQPEIEMKDAMRLGDKFTLPKGYENPLVRSGLAFAGANNANEAETSLDGLLTALEVTAMDLHGTDLVTLSACKTAVGDVKTGEGVYGLRRSFALAGTRNLLMSLWSVTDKITAEQMETFYRLYGQGKNPSDALRQAQLETIAQLRKKYGVARPSLWAPFILQGVPSRD